MQAPMLASKILKIVNNYAFMSFRMGSVCHANVMHSIVVYMVMMMMYFALENAIGTEAAAKAQKSEQQRVNGTILL